jgi:ribosome-associated translation inhibitor RaiA
VNFRMHFQDLPHSQFLQTKCQAQAGALQIEFPEITRVEVTHTHSGDDRATHVHALGRHIDLASNATSRSARESIQEAFGRLHRQLRKHHDKHVYNRRRERAAAGARAVSS